jgi:TonB family protein
MINGINREDYLHLLLFNTNECRPDGICNNFNILLTKKRIKMMTDKKTKKRVWLKVIPAIVLTICFLAVHTGYAQQPLNKKVTIEKKELDEVVVTAYAISSKPENEKLKKESKKTETAPLSTYKKKENPEFLKGTDGFFMYLRNNLKYPTVALENGIQGKVILNFIVKSTGEISDIKVFKGIDPSLDAEALRLIQSMPKWIPDEEKVEPVDVEITLPVDFKISE